MVDKDVDGWRTPWKSDLRSCTTISAGYFDMVPEQRTQKKKKMCEEKSYDGSFISGYTLWWGMVILGDENCGYGQRAWEFKSKGRIVRFWLVFLSELNVNQTKTHWCGASWRHEIHLEVEWCCFREFKDWRLMKNERNEEQPKPLPRRCGFGSGRAAVINRCQFRQRNGNGSLSSEERCGFWQR